MPALAWILFLLLFALLLWSRRGLSKARLRALQDAGATVLDVRTPGEFAQGHVEGALNLPLDRLKGGLDGLDRARPVLCCCASGARSAAAAAYLRSQGFEAHNAGPWTRLRRLP